MDKLFENTSIKRAYFILALPVVMSMAVTIVYNMVDTFFVAKTGNPDLVAGVSQGAPIFTLMIAIGDISGLGGSSVISVSSVSAAIRRPATSAATASTHPSPVVWSSLP